jgi:sulfite exporter TauE/SafE
MNWHGISEALLLGLATGPVCLATCGPVVAPWMLAQPQGVWRQTRQLSLFLSARLLGYLLFAVAAWLAGEAVPRAWEAHGWPVALVDLLLAAAMVAWAMGWPRRNCGQQNQDQLVQIGQPLGRQRASSPTLSALTLGFLTGINFCPPFLAAGIRAAQLNHLAGALVFFAAFFLGTVVWFVPVAALGLVRRSSAIVAVARITALLMALWYAGMGMMILAGEGLHG